MRLTLSSIILRVCWDLVFPKSQQDQPMSVFVFLDVRYQLLNPNVIPQGFVDNKKASELVLGSLDLGENEYKIGHTKVLRTVSRFVGGGEKLE